MSKKKRTGLQRVLHSRFYRVYFCVVALALAALCVGRVWLNGVLVDYEAAQPVYVAEKVADLFEQGDYETIYQLDTSAAEIAGGDESFYLDSLRELSEGRDVEWSEAYSPNEDERRYSVTLDGDRFATFSLVPSGETTRHGNTLWKLGSVSTLVQVQATPEAPEETPAPATPVGIDCVITAPEGCTVTVDGVELTEANASIASRPVITEEGFLPAGVESVTYREYRHTSTTESPVVEAKDASGSALTVTQVDANTWSCPLTGDETFRERYSGGVFSLAKRVARIMVGDARVDSMKKFCAAGSPARNIFDNLGNRWVTPHTGSSFENIVVSEFFLHSENCFTCHVSFDFILDTKVGKQTYPTAYTFCVIRDGGKAKLYNLLMR